MVEARGRVLRLAAALMALIALVCALAVTLPESANAETAEPEGVVDPTPDHV